MRTRTSRLAALLVLGALPFAAHAAEDDKAARAREMVHRAQEALQQAQTENADLARAKAEAEQKAVAAAKQLEADQATARTAQQGLQAQLQAARKALADANKQLASTRDELQSANQVQRETAAQLAKREGELAQLQKSLDASVAANMGCEDKNLKLYAYANEVLERYRHKGVWASMAQKEPVLGFGDVAIQNVVQEYRIKFDAQRAKP
jgi:chromosome segregation ATPase